VGAQTERRGRMEASEDYSQNSDSEKTSWVRLLVIPTVKGTVTVSQPDQQHGRTGAFLRGFDEIQQHPTEIGGVFLNK
jgi:hypothetical protein